MITRHWKRAPVIVRPVTADGMAGFDEFDQFHVAKEIDPDRYEYIFLADVRHETCSICNHGWDLTAESLRDQCFWRLIDKHVHESCLVRFTGLCERGEFFDAVCSAKVRFAGLVPVKQGYWPDAYEDSKKPWYEAKLLDFPAKFTLGWRKRVIEVSLTPCDGAVFDWFALAEAEFAQENVTKVSWSLRTRQASTPA